MVIMQNRWSSYSVMVLPGQCLYTSPTSKSSRYLPNGLASPMFEPFICRDRVSVACRALPSFLGQALDLSIRGTDRAVDNWVWLAARANLPPRWLDIAPARGGHDRGVAAAVSFHDLDHRREKDVVDVCLGSGGRKRDERSNGRPRRIVGVVTTGPEDSEIGSVRPDHSHHSIFRERDLAAVGRP